MTRNQHTAGTRGTDLDVEAAVRQIRVASNGREA